MVRLFVGPQGVHPQTRLTAFCRRMPTPAPINCTRVAMSMRHACWDHARRKGYDLHASTPSSDTQTLLAMIGERYGIEAD
ncbi:MAG: transposase, partial [Burkholderia sp.]